MQKPVRTRHYGIDLLRIVATAMIVVHHLICNGGLAALFPPLSPSYILYHTLNILAYCAVNLYGLISGYTMAGRTWRLSRLLELWLQVVVTGVLVTAGLKLFANVPVTGRDWLSALIPLSFHTYWYFSAYVGMYLFLPVVHRGLESMDRRTCLLTLCAMGSAFMLLPLVVSADPFEMRFGYDMTWLLFLYITGYFFRRFGFGKLEKHAALLYPAALLAAAASRFGLAWLQARGLFGAVPIVWLEKYTSPTLFAASAALLCLFARIHLPPRAEKLVRLTAPLTLGVYLIHAHPLAYDQIIRLIFVPYSHWPFIRLFLLFVLLCAAVFGVCLLLDALRLRLFCVLRVRACTEAIEKRLRHWACAHVKN